MMRAGIQEHPVPGGGNRYTLDGRDYVCSNRCAFCREFGCFFDTGICPDCEVRIPKAARLIAKAKRAGGAGAAAAGAGAEGDGDV